ncbi:hypothetical protein NQ315_016287 [Exocentrus adspersus]|uniref:DDE Tnp4 domain-containing protein n=1 Tax=Exocentrus adspersus TaxID=1586481 RepID=A0AAV8VCU0_9CUCU|nr:hypothetical protein NQ315_016287 [Exocentrus adspersus]
MGKQLINNELEFPSDCPVEYGGENIPFYLVGDEAFPLRTNLVRHVQEDCYQKKRESAIIGLLSRARRVSENTFGIWVARWRIFRRPINTCLETTEHMIKATICLHNYLMGGRHELYCPTNFVDTEDINGNITSGLWRDEASPNNVFSLTRMGSNNTTLNAGKIRSHLTS